MSAALQIPVTEVLAELVLGSGTAHGVCMYVPLGQSVEDVLASSSPFITATESDKFRLFARSDIACVTLLSVMDWTVDLPTQRRDVLVHLTNGREMRGHLRVVPSLGYSRTADHLNAGDESIALFADGCVHYIAKSHVAYVEEM